MPETQQVAGRPNGVTWREYVDTRINALEKATEAARVNMDRRLDSMNEIREQLRAQADTFVTGVEHKALCDRLERLDVGIRSLELSRSELYGKASQHSVNQATLIAAIGIALAIIGIVIRFL